MRIRTYITPPSGYKGQDCRSICIPPVYVNSGKEKDVRSSSFNSLLNLSMKPIKEDETIISRKGCKQRREKGKKKKSSWNKPKTKNTRKNSP